MLKLISLKICPFVQRVAALMEAKKVPYEIEYIDFDNLPAWFSDVSPNAQVPVLITESGQALFESEAIIEYLDEIHPPLESELSAEQKAVDRAWSYQANNLYLPQCSTMRSPDKETLAERAEKLSKAFDKVEKQLGDGPFFKGDTLSNIDIAWLPVLHRSAIINENAGYDFLAKHPKVKAWRNSLMQTDIVEKSVADDFDDIFKGFYLSDSTYLGAGENCDITSDTSSCSAASCG